MHGLTTTTSNRQIRVVDVHGSTVVPPTLINCYSALSIPAYKRAMSFLADNLASFPRSVRRDGAKPPAGHALDRMLKRRPNGYQSPFTFWRTLFFHAAHTGNGYARIERQTDGDGRPLIGSRAAALHNLRPEDVRPFRYLPDPSDDHPIPAPIQFYAHLPTKTVLAGPDVLHLQSLGHDGQAAMDPVDLHEGALQRAATLERYQTQYLSKGTLLKGAIEIPADMTEDQMAQMRAVLRRFRGADGEDDMLILTNGGKLNNSTTSAQDAQLVQQAAHSTKQIAQMTGVPPSFLYELSEEKYRNTVEQDGQNVVRYTFRPWIEMAEDELTLKLLTDAEQEQGLTIHINPDALLRGDTKTQVDTVTATVNAGLASKNEGRENLGLPRDPDPESDKLKTLGDTAPAAAAAAPLKQNATARPAAEAFAALAPVLAAACARVDTKTAKAFDTHGRKTGQELTIWANLFSAEQERYAGDALRPVSEALAALGAPGLDVPRIAGRYAAGIRRRAATGEPVALADLANSPADVKDHAAD